MRKFKVTQSVQESTVVTLYDDSTDGLTEQDVLDLVHALAAEQRWLTERICSDIVEETER